MKVIAVTNQKGGCGKTITAINLSAALARAGHRTLLIDLDPQAHASYTLAGSDKITITDLLEQAAHSNLNPSDLAGTAIAENLYFIPASLGLASAEQKMTGKNRFQMLATVLAAMPAEFEYCLIDCPPSLGLLTLNALAAADYTLIPLNSCDFSLRGAEIMKTIFVMLKEHLGKAPTPFYLLNQLDLRSRHGRSFSERARAKLGNMLLNAPVRTSVSLKEAASGHKNIFAYDPYSRGAEDFTAVAAEVGRLTQSTRWQTLFYRGKDLSAVYVAGDFNAWQKEEQYRLRKFGDDIWTINLPLAKGHYRYKFVAGEAWVPDPYNRATEKDPFGGINSLLEVK